MFTKVFAINIVARSFLGFLVRKFMASDLGPGISCRFSSWVVFKENKAFSEPEKHAEQKIKATIPISESIIEMLSDEENSGLKICNSALSGGSPIFN
jgi:hypothetical protein